MIVLDTEYNILAANTTTYWQHFSTVDKLYIGHKRFQISHHYDVPCDRAGKPCPIKKAFEKCGPDHVCISITRRVDRSRATSNYPIVRNASASPKAQGLIGRIGHWQGIVWVE
ncbi:MAG TPA: hypothetical protein VM571_14590 [Noviherbaspirillum sp.]|nr:hypothetical protein [Noviherbaspirillum sp.]